MKRLALTAAFLVAGCSGTAPTPILVYVTPSPAALGQTANPPQTPQVPPSASLTIEPPTASETVVLEGSTDLTTAPFDLTGGDYRVTITVKGPACYWSAGVFALGSGELDTATMGLASVSLGADEPGPKAVETFEYGVPAGSYYMVVHPGAGGCPWKVEIAPIS